MAYSFPKRVRLLRPSEFERVFRQRCSSADGEMVMYAARNDLGHARLGLTVSRKVGRAVQRNRWKRALREAFRLTQNELPPLDLICLPRSGGAPDVHQLVAAFPRLARKLEVRLRTHARPKRERADRAPRR